MHVNNLTAHERPKAFSWMGCKMIPQDYLPNIHMREGRHRHGALHSLSSVWSIIGRHSKVWHIHSSPRQRRSRWLGMPALISSSFVELDMAANHVVRGWWNSWGHSNANLCQQGGGWGGGGAVLQQTTGKWDLLYDLTIWIPRHICVGYTVSYIYVQCTPPQWIYNEEIKKWFQP